MDSWIVVVVLLQVAQASPKSREAKKCCDVVKRYLCCGCGLSEVRSGRAEGGICGRFKVTDGG